MSRILSALKIRPHLQLKLIALFLAISGTIVGVLAYEKQITDLWTVTIYPQAGTQFGISVKSNNNNFQDGSEFVMAKDGSIAFDPIIVNNGDYKTYVFMELFLPDDLTIEADGVDETNWHRLTGMPYKDRFVYVYGEEGRELSYLAGKSDQKSYFSSETVPLCTNLKANSDQFDSISSAEDEPCKVAVRAYAIQAKGLGDADYKDVRNSPDPEKLFALIEQKEAAQ